MPDLGVPATLPPALSHTSTQQWQSFEIRMRYRRAERCVLRAEVALEAGFEEDARAALDEARHLNSQSPDFDTLRAEVYARLAASEAARRAAQRRRIASYAAAVLLVLTVGVGAFWVQRDTPARVPGAAETQAAALPPAQPPAVTVAETQVAAPVTGEVAQPGSGSATPDPLPAQAEAPTSDRAADPKAGAPPVPAPERPRAEAAVLREPLTSPSAAAGVPASVAPGLPESLASPGPPASGPPASGLPVSGLSGAETPGSVVTPPAPGPPVPPAPAPAAPSPSPAVAERAAEARPPAVRPVENREAPAAEAVVAPTAEAVVAEEPRVRAALARYEAAYSALNASQAQAVWPGVDQRSLARAFESLESQRVALGRCSVAVQGKTAEATCNGSVTWTPKVGGGAQTATRQWRFELASAGSGWQIIRAEAR